MPRGRYFVSGSAITRRPCMGINKAALPLMDSLLVESRLGYIS